MEKSMVVNHLGPFLLTNLLLPDLRRSAHDGRGETGNSPGSSPASRIVNVGSRLEKRGSLWAAAAADAGGEIVHPGTRWFEPPPGKDHEPFQLYGSSKLCNQLFTFELDRRLKAAQREEKLPATAAAAVTANIVTPGVVNTGIGDSTVSPWVAWAGAPLKAAFMRTVEKGAETVVWAATSPEAEAIGSGKFFGDKKEVPTSDTSRDEDLARRLWEASEVASGLDDSERVL